ncbi:MAG TPA: hypothetical protein VH413_07455 [Verrucomicrobiae bacterium]|jgi:hypothetical protein|nr:hypothetical protein [Verrucomicrobiae bacterium]
METAAGTLTGIVGLVLAALAFILAIFWILLPLLLLAKMDKILKEMQKLNEGQSARQYDVINNLNSIVSNTAVTAAAVSPQTKVG